MSDIHLLVLIQGMWGNPNHLAEMDRIIREVKDTDSDGPQLAVLVAKTNSDESTYDGIDWGGERVAQEILDEIEEYEKQGKKVTRFSVTGYSLGGLVARYVIGILHQNKFFEKVIPVNFNTIATPHIGIPRFPSTFSAFANYIGPRLLSRTGPQFFCVDRWSPKGRPLLDILADPDHIFYQALILFPNLRIYANAINDTTVPYITAAIEESDSFAEHETKGIEIEFHDEYKHVIKSYAASSSPPPPRARESTSLLTKIRNLNPPVPPMLQGGFPLNLLVYALLPIIMPTFISLVLLRLSISSHKSRARLQTLAVDWSNREVLSNIVGELESKFESVILDVYENSGATPSLSSEDQIDVDLTVSEGLNGSLDSKPSPFQPLLSPVQRRCIQNLNNIPQLQKERAFFTGVRNSHAMIVCRDIKNFKFHLEGESVVRHWADQFEL